MNAEFKVTDRRTSSLITSNLSSELTAAKRDDSRRQQQDLDSKVIRAMGGRVREGSAEATEMRHNRRTASRVTAGGQTGNSGLSFATGRPRDPMFYWKNNNLPYDVEKPEELRLIREYCRLLYLTHPVIASAIDIFSKYPLTGMELTCKDPALTTFYTDLFLDQLDYEEFLLDIGREYWTVGEVWPLGSFNEMLGIWEDDQLINPDNVEVRQTPFSREPQYFMRLPETLRNILKTGQPRAQYDALIRYDASLKDYIHEDAVMSVSSHLMRQLKFKGSTFNPRGVPILMRGFRAIMQEEMLNAAQDSIADRLYTPLILVKLGASASDLGTSQPWIPNQDDIMDFEESLDTALAADFRVLTHHFGVDMQPVFGRETMPNLDADFDRLTGRILQVFGMSQTMLSGAGSGQTYAADALNRDLITQLLTHYQRLLKKFFRERALVVAEARDHFDYEVRGGKRYPIMEEILEVDEKGNERIVERPKLLVPELHMKTMKLQDENTEREFYEALRGSGVPISMKRRLVNIDIDLDEEKDQVKDEQVDLIVQAQEVRKAAFQALSAAGLPIPEDLEADFRPKAKMPEQPAVPAAPEMRPALMGVDEAGSTEALLPSEEAMMVPPGVPLGEVDPILVGESGGVPAAPQYQSQRPAESDEMRAGMPRAGRLDYKPGKRAYPGLTRDTPIGSETGTPVQIVPNLLDKRTAAHVENTLTPTKDQEDTIEEKTA